MEQPVKQSDQYNSCINAIDLIRTLYLEGTLDEDKARQMIGTCLWGPEPGSVYTALQSIQKDYDNHKITEKQASTFVVELICSLHDDDFLKYSCEEPRASIS